MDNLIKNYTLDCGCFFEHSKKAGCASFELTICCDDHARAGTKLSSPPGLPPNPFMAKQAGDVTHRVTRTRWITAPDGVGVVANGADANVVAGLLTDNGPNALPQVQTNSRYEADVERAVEKAFVPDESWRCPHGVRHDKHCDECGIPHACEHLEHTQPIPPLHTRQAASLEEDVDVRELRACIADVTNDIEGVKDRLSEMEDKLEELCNRLPQVER